MEEKNSSSARGGDGSSREEPSREVREVMRRRRCISLCVFALILVLIYFLGPWGPFGDALYSNSRTSPGPYQPAEKGSLAEALLEAGSSRPVNRPQRLEKPSDPTPPAVAIVVDDVGTSEEKLPAWLQVDAPISFAVLPCTQISAKLADEFYNNGYAVMMHVPTQNKPPNSFSGVGQLACGMDRATVFATLDADLATVPHVSGINNHQGGLGCDDRQLMMYECEWAKDHELYVVDSDSSASSQVSFCTEALGMGKRKNEVFIDHQNDPDYIRAAMRRLADLARENGYSIGICHYHRPNTAAVVGEMVKALEAEGIHFVFARDITD